MASDLGAFQRDARQNRARHGLAHYLIGQFEYTLVHACFIKILFIALAQLAVNGRIAHVQPAAQRAHRQLRLPWVGGAVVDQVAVQGQACLDQAVQRCLEGRVAAGVMAGVVVCEAVERLGVVHRVAQQMRGAEIHPALAGENGLADGAGAGVRVTAGVLLGEGHRHLHRAAGVNGVEAAKELLAQRRHGDEVVEHLAQFALGAHLSDALGVGGAGGGAQVEGSVDQEARDVGLCSAAVDFFAGDAAQARHLRVGLEVGLLLDDGDDGAEVVWRWVEGLGLEGGLDVGGPAGAVGDVGR